MPDCIGQKAREQIEKKLNDFVIYELTAGMGVLNKKSLQIRAIRKVLSENIVSFVNALQECGMNSRLGGFCGSIMKLVKDNQLYFEGNKPTLTVTLALDDDMICAIEDTCSILSEIEDLSDRRKDQVERLIKEIQISISEGIANEEYIAEIREKD